MARTGILRDITEDDNAVYFSFGISCQIEYRACSSPLYSVILSVGTAPTLPASNSSLPLLQVLPSVQSVVQKDDMCHTVTIQR